MNGQDPNIEQTDPTNKRPEWCPLISDKALEDMQKAIAEFNLDQVLSEMGKIKKEIRTGHGKFVFKGNTK